MLDRPSPGLAASPGDHQLEPAVGRSSWKVQIWGSLGRKGRGRSRFSYKRAHTRRLDPHPPAALGQPANEVSAICMGLDRKVISHGHR